MAEKVLLVDDEQDFLGPLAARLRRRGVNVVVETSSDRVSDQCSATSFDVVVVDMIMPNRDGFQVLTLIHDNWPEIPVIFLTGYGTIPACVKAMKMGAWDYLEKPVDVGLLTERIRDAAKYKKRCIEQRQEQEIRNIAISKPW